MTTVPPAMPIDLASQNLQYARKSQPTSRVTLNSSCKVASLWWVRDTVDSAELGFPVSCPFSVPWPECPKI